MNCESCSKYKLDLIKTSVNFPFFNVVKVIPFLVFQCLNILPFMRSPNGCAEGRVMVCEFNELLDMEEQAVQNVQKANRRGRARTVKSVMNVEKPRQPRQPRAKNTIKKEEKKINNTSVSVKPKKVSNTRIPTVDIQQKEFLRILPRMIKFDEYGWFLKDDDINNSGDSISDIKSTIDIHYKNIPKSFNSLKNKILQGLYQKGKNVSKPSALLLVNDDSNLPKNDVGCAKIEANNNNYDSCNNDKNENDVKDQKKSSDNDNDSETIFKKDLDKTEQKVDVDNENEEDSSDGNTSGDDSNNSDSSNSLDEEDYDDDLENNNNDNTNIQSFHYGFAGLANLPYHAC